MESRSVSPVFFAMAAPRSACPPLLSNSPRTMYTRWRSNAAVPRASRAPESSASRMASSRASTPFVGSIQPQERGAPDHLRVGEQADGFYLTGEARGPLRRVQAFGEPAAGEVKPRESAVKRGHCAPRALRRAWSVERRQMGREPRGAL